MKKFLMIAVLMISVASFAQKTEYIKVSGRDYQEFLNKNQYKYPEYRKARITMKNGEVASARVNFDYFNQKMKFIGEKGDTMEIANENDLSTITVGADSFFYDNGYLEWVASSGKARLASRTTFKRGATALVGAFGTSSPAKNIESKSMLLQESNYTLAQNEETTYTKETTYYINASGNNNFVTANKNNFNRLFPKKNVADYIRENNINLTKEQDLVDVMVYISK